MNSRTRKRQIYGMYRRRGDSWLTAEDRDWDNMVPIGREFGSKDFERLSILDAFTQGRMDDQKAMALLGIDHDALLVMAEKDGLTANQFAGEVEGSALHKFAKDDIAPDSSKSLLPAREFQKKLKS